MRAGDFSEKDLLTFQDLANNLEKYVDEFKRIKKMAKFCGSTINECLLHGSLHQFILEVAKFAELHVMEGVGNFMCQNLFNDVGGEIASRFTDKLKIKTQHFKAEQFVGNDVKKILDNCHYLVDKAIMGEEKEETLLKYYKAMDSFNTLVCKLFNSGLKDDNLDVDKIIETAKNCYLDLNINITLKVHIVFSHTKQALQYSDGRNLGYISEQAGEQVHQTFDKIWSRYKTLNQSSSTFGPNLRKAVVDFSSKNVF